MISGNSLHNRSATDHQVPQIRPSKDQIHGGHGSPFTARSRKSRSRNPSGGVNRLNLYSDCLETTLERSSRESRNWASTNSRILAGWISRMDRNAPDYGGITKRAIF